MIRKNFRKKLEYLERFKSPGSLLDVVKHITEPVKVLKNAYDLLKPGGILLVVTGNADCLWARVLGRRWYFHHPPQRLLAFSASNLCSALRERGFAETKVKTFGRSISVNNALFKLSTLSSSRIVRAVADSLRESLRANMGFYVRFGDEMVVLAFKGGSK